MTPVVITESVVASAARRDKTRILVHSDERARDTSLVAQGGQSEAKRNAPTVKESQDKESQMIAWARRFRALAHPALVGDRFVAAQRESERVLQGD